VKAGRSSRGFVWPEEWPLADPKMSEEVRPWLER
jgi:hypothetical protein